MSDHSPICIQINTNDGVFKKGQNYWKFNSSLLNDNVYTAGMKKLIEEKGVEYAEMDKQIKWELIKFKIRKFTMEYSKKWLEKKKSVITKRKFN